MSSNPELIPVASLSAFDGDDSTVVQVDGRAIALFKHEDEVYAVDNRCPHMGFE
jgi:nitrite reductase/ring-hydroxylating ferredoxin subunit